MARIHLFEIEDQSWFPQFLRNYLTDFLQFLANKTPMWDGIIPILSKIVEQDGNNKIIDLGSGGGGGILRINRELLKHHDKLQITLTDFYPNVDAFKHTQSQAPNISYTEKSVDARKVPSELKGVRTQFLSLHHFNPDDAGKILQNAVDSKSTIAIFEAQERSVPSLLAMFFSPIMVVFVTPFIRPFKWARLFFTYLIPVVPICVWWDGIVSSLRTYSVKEMKELVAKLENKDSFDWEIKRVKTGPTAVLYLVGSLKKS